MNFDGKIVKLDSLELLNSIQEGYSICNKCGRTVCRWIISYCYSQANNVGFKNETDISRMMGDMF